MTSEGLNQTVWAQRATVRAYEDTQGFIDAGERAVFSRIAELVRGQPILDLGVGAGRTAALLAPLSSRYVALDYVPEMVEACHRSFPELDVQVGDARDLGRFADASFGLVSFSFNGIDAIDHAGRQQVMHEVHRVLKPGGLFWFSTLNLDGIGRRMPPWRPEWPLRDGHAFRFMVRALWMLARIPKRMRNRARLKSHFEHGSGWCIDTLSAHDYQLLMHYTTLERELAELSVAGFRANPLVLDCSYGKPVSLDDDRRNVFWYHVLAEK
jgi:SAM-dependent methyltransferase